MIRLVGPGGAGKTTIGTLLAARLNIEFIDLDRQFNARSGDISEYINRFGYSAYAQENVETYLRHLCLTLERRRAVVVALSSGFMTYRHDIHSQYGRVLQDLHTCPNTFVLLPSCDSEVCVTETVRRQATRPFGRSPVKEERIIRQRFEFYMALPMRKVETMRSAPDVVDEIASALVDQAGKRGVVSRGRRA